MRYYSTQRPFGPGTFPKQDGSEAITNFDGPTSCEEIGGREAWGYIDYKYPLSPTLVQEYELVPASKRIKLLKFIGTDSWSRYVYKDENGKIWKHLDCCSPREVCIERGDTLYSSCGNSFDGEPDCPMRADIECYFKSEETKN